MSFGSPYLLLTLVCVPLAAVGYGVVERRRARRSGAWSNRALLPNMVRRPPRRSGWIPLGFFLLGLTLLLVGFARPQRVLSTVTGSTPIVVLAVDVSGSMAAEDVRPSRIGAARAIAVRFLHQLPPHDRVALVTFGNDVSLRVHPTLDRRRVIAALPAKVIPKSATALGDAISEGTALITESVGQSAPGASYHPGVVLLVSDGAQTAGGTTPTNAANQAYLAGVPVDAIPVGTPSGSVTQLFNVGGVRTAASLPAPVDRDGLHVLTRQTGGVFLPTSSSAQLERVYANLRSTVSYGHKTKELTALVGALALVPLLAGIVVSGLWFGRVA
jgi:Ca-activated chloride channel homolog